MHISEITSHKAVAAFTNDPSRQTYLPCVEGDVSLMPGDGQANLLHHDDGAELNGPLGVRPSADGDADQYRGGLLKM